MNLNENQKILVLRYGNNIIKDCIEKHIEVLTENGYCWFGKIGRAPSTKVLKSVLINGKGTLILYSRSGCYLCGFSEVTAEQPHWGYPQYYDSYILNKGNLPSIYLKLNSIEKKDSSFLSQFVVVARHQFWRTHFSPPSAVRIQEMPPTVCKNLRRSATVTANTILCKISKSPSDGGMTIEGLFCGGLRRRQRFPDHDQLARMPRCCSMSARMLFTCRSSTAFSLVRWTNMSALPASWFTTRGIPCETEWMVRHAASVNTGRLRSAACILSSRYFWHSAADRPPKWYCMRIRWAIGSIRLLLSVRRSFPCPARMTGKTGRVLCGSVIRKRISSRVASGISCASSISRRMSRPPERERDSISSRHCCLTFVAV